MKQLLKEMFSKCEMLEDGAHIDHVISDEDTDERENVPPSSDTIKTATTDTDE